MGIKNRILFGLGAFAGGLLIACAAPTFPYHPYVVDPDRDLLLGPTPADDRSLRTLCQPDDQVKGKCLVYLLAEHKKLEADYLKVKQDLATCQTGK